MVVKMKLKTLIYSIACVLGIKSKSCCEKNNPVKKLTPKKKGVTMAEEKKETKKKDTKKKETEAVVDAPKVEAPKRKKP